MRTLQGGSDRDHPGVVTASYPSGTGSHGRVRHPDRWRGGGGPGLQHARRLGRDLRVLRQQARADDRRHRRGEGAGRGSASAPPRSPLPAARHTITALPTPQPPVVPNDVIPGTDCELPGTGCPTVAELDAAREEFEHEAFQPTGDYTVTDAYDGSPGASFGMQGEIGIAAEQRPPADDPDRDHRPVGHRGPRRAPRLQRRAPAAPRRRQERQLRHLPPPRTRRSRGSPRTTRCGPAPR